MFKSPAENKSQGTLETTSKGGTLTRSVTHFVFTEEYFGRSSFFILIFKVKVMLKVYDRQQSTK